MHVSRAICISWHFFRKSFRRILLNLQYCRREWIAASCACLILSYYYQDILGVKKVSTSLHTCSIQIWHKNLFNVSIWRMFPTSGPHWAKVTRKQSRVLQGWLQPWEATHPLVGQYLASNHLVSLWEGWYTCASLSTIWYVDIVLVCTSVYSFNHILSLYSSTCLHGYWMSIRTHAHMESHGKWRCILHILIHWHFPC